jgi:hypothetical protein
VTGSPADKNCKTPCGGDLTVHCGGVSNTPGYQLMTIFEACCFKTYRIGGRPVEYVGASSNGKVTLRAPAHHPLYKPVASERECMKYTGTRAQAFGGETASDQDLEMDTALLKFGVVTPSWSECWTACLGEAAHTSNGADGGRSCRQAVHSRATKRCFFLSGFVGDPAPVLPAKATEDEYVLASDELYDYAHCYADEAPDYTDIGEGMCRNGAGNKYKVASGLVSDIAPVTKNSKGEVTQTAFDRCAAECNARSHCKFISFGWQQRCLLYSACDAPSPDTEALLTEPFRYAGKGCCRGSRGGSSGDLLGA